MKLTVLSSEHTWCTEDLARAAKEKGVEIAHYGYERLPLPEEKKPLGDVVLVRFMRIHKIFERPFLFTEEERAGTQIINEILFRDPMILYKSVQQYRIQKMQDKEVIGIPTYSGTKREHIWELIEKGVLTLP